MAMLPGCPLAFITGLLLVLKAYMSSACPVTVKVNHTNHCECTLLNDIHCYDLDAIPVFNKEDGMIYSSLYMDKQGIREIENAVFFNLKVKRIVLDLNPIGDNIAVNALTGLESTIEELYMGGCKIRTLPSGLLIGMQKLKILHLWGNQVRDLPPNWFKGARYLEELHLWGNQIRSIDRDSFNALWDLRRLDLDRNRIETVHKEMFKHLGRLELLSLRDNNLKTINEESFTHMVNLRVLNLDGNGVAFVWPKAFHNLKNLVSLSLRNNAIGLISDQFLSHLRNLTVLHLEHNMLRHLWAKNFDGLRNLQELDLSQNQLNELPVGLFRQAPRLNILYLDNNKLKTLDKCVLHRKARLSILSLVGNPVACDCDLTWMYDLHVRGVNVWGTCDTISEDSSEKMSPIINDRNYFEGYRCEYEVSKCSRS